MFRPRVWIHYSPKLYTDLFKKIIQSMDVADVLDTLPMPERPFADHRNGCRVDVVVLSLNAQGKPDLDLPLDNLPQTKIIAFSSRGDYGLRRMPGANTWEVMRPFGLKQFVSEVVNIPNFQNA